MELLDRYLHSVRFWLPRSQQKDILAELSEDIRSEIEEKESAQGRKLSESEVEAMLKQRGSPYKVASRYLPQRYLIGPAFFPLYTLILKAITVFYLVPWLAVWLFMVAFLPSYRAAHPGFELLGTLKELWNVALYAFVITTIVVVGMERSAQGTGFMDPWERKWNPPAPRDVFRIARGEAIGELLGGIVFAFWWLGVIHRPEITGLTLDFSPPIYQYLYGPILVISLAGTVLAAINLFRPYWTHGRLVARVIVDGLEATVMGVFLSVATPVLVKIAAATPAQEQLLQYWVNMSVRITVLAIGIFALVDGVRGLWLLSRRRPAPQAVAGPAAGTRLI